LGKGKVKNRWAFNGRWEKRASPFAKNKNAKVGNPEKFKTVAAG
jgi:hypothetical protein